MKLKYLILKKRIYEEINSTIKRREIILPRKVGATHFKRIESDWLDALEYSIEMSKVTPKEDFEKRFLGKFPNE